MGITYSHNNSTITIIWQKTQLLQLKLLSIVQRNWNVERGKKNSIYKKEAHKSELQKTKQKKRCQGHLLKNKKNKIFHNIHLKKKNLRELYFSVDTLFWILNKRPKVTH